MEAISDEQIVESIIRRISEEGKRQYATDGEFISSLGLGVSHIRVKRVLGRLVNEGSIIRSRPHSEHPGDSDRPITYWLSRRVVE